VTHRGPELQLRIAAGADLQQVVVAAVVQLDRADDLRVAAVQALGEAQQGGERANGAPHLASERPELVMVPLRLALTVIARDERDRFHFLGLESAKVAVLDQVVRVFVVPLVADMDAEIVQDRRVLQPLALEIREAVNRARLVEERDGEARDLMRVLRPEVASLGELEDAAAANVRIAIRLRDLLPMLRDVIEHEPFTQRQVAQRELLCTEPTEDFVDENDARDGEIGAPRFEARHAQTLLERHRGEILAEAAHLLCGDAAIAQRCGLASPFRSRDDGAHAENRARRADDPVEAGARDLIEVFPDFRVDVAHELAFVARLEGIALDEAFGQSNDAELEAPSELDRGAAAPGDLDAAAADVDDDRNIAGDSDAVHGGGMDEPCFLCAGDHARTNAGFPVYGLQEFAAVLRFAHGARRDGYHIFNPV
jgi:hypothetical protein